MVCGGIAEVLAPAGRSAGGLVDSAQGSVGQQGGVGRVGQRETEWRAWHTSRPSPALPASSSAL